MNNGLKKLYNSKNSEYVSQKVFWEMSFFTIKRRILLSDIHYYYFKQNIDDFHRFKVKIRRYRQFSKIMVKCTLYEWSPVKGWVKLTNGLFYRNLKLLNDEIDILRILRETYKREIRLNLA